MLPDIRAFFESEEGKREFEEWKTKREKKLAEKNTRLVKNKCKSHKTYELNF